MQTPWPGAVITLLVELLLLSPIVGCAVHGSASGRLGRRGSPTPSRAPDPRQPCEVPLAKGVVLSPHEACWVDQLKRRCTPDDACLVECFANAKHRVWQGDHPSESMIGGGCWHVCFGSTKLDWKSFHDWETCEGLDSNLPAHEDPAE